ncbi:MAG: magnesium transporter CorA family protein, partial [Lentisphaeria bacterium]|nr:magnesium transporter CorA family protein [Lentisphaeria bacterium]
LPTLLTSIYGMNLDNLPLAHHPYAFVIISGIGVFLAIVAIIVMIKRRWI